METEMAQIQMEAEQEIEPQPEIEEIQEVEVESSMAPTRMFADANNDFLEFTEEEKNFFN